MSNPLRRAVVWVPIAVVGALGSLIAFAVWAFGLGRYAEDYCSSSPLFTEGSISYQPRWTGPATITCDYQRHHGPRVSHRIHDTAPLEWTLVIAAILLVSLATLVVVGVLVSRHWTRPRHRPSHRSPAHQPA